MDDDAQYRSRVHRWLRDVLPEGWGITIREPTDEHERIRFKHDWDRKVYAGGWAGISWPREYGGQGGTVFQKAIVLEEMARSRAPEGLCIVGRNVVGPTLISHGSPAQKERYIRPILSADEIWCLGLSEPGAGSDLASVSCRATPSRGGYSISGQKTWTSYAQYAQWCLLLARTGPAASRQKGLTMFLVDMSSSGIEVRPLRQMTGASEFNDVFFDDVFVPADNVLGPVNGGWDILMTSLSAERGPEEALHRQMLYRQYFDELLDWARTSDVAGTSRCEDPVVRQKLAQGFIELEIMRLDCLRGFSRLRAGHKPGPNSSVTKLYWSQAFQNVMDTAMDLQGPGSILDLGDPASPANGLFQHEFLWSRAATIYSGTSQVQRNIIAERILGLPREGSEK